MIFNVILKALRSLFNVKILMLSLVPLIISAIFWAIVFWLFSDQIDAGLTYILSFTPFNNDTVKSIVTFIGGSIIYYELLVLTSVLIVGIIADKVVDIINEKEYHLQKEGFGTLIGSMWISLKYNLIFVFLFILFLPTIFIPFLNIVVHLFLWAILIKNPFLYDSISSIATKEEYEQLQQNKLDLWVISLISASLFFVPILGILVYILQLLVFIHYNLTTLKEIRIKKTYA